MDNALKEIEVTLQASDEKAKAFDDALRHAGEQGAASDAEAIAMAADAIGLSLSPEEVERALADAAELCDDDLEQAAGGTGQTSNEDEYGHQELCAFTWHCSVALMHTESNDKETLCFSNYACLTVYHYEYYK